MATKFYGSRESGPLVIQDSAAGGGSRINSINPVALSLFIAINCLLNRLPVLEKLDAQWSTKNILGRCTA